jgi:hypothetical protein
MYIVRESDVLVRERGQCRMSQVLRTFEARGSAGV